MNKYKKTKTGVINTMYGSQRGLSRKREHHLPRYTHQELKEWCFKQPIFHKLYRNWVKSGYYKMAKPSCDRLDNSKGYTFDNLRIVTFHENAAGGAYIIGKREKTLEHRRKLSVRHKGKSPLKNGAWSFMYKHCKKCKSKKRVHEARGLCSLCYQQERLANTLHKWLKCKIIQRR